VDSLDAVIEIFTWLGFGGAVLLGIVAVAFWVADGTWLPVEALVDHEDDGTFVRWYDADGDANSVLAGEADAAELAGRDRAHVWYRYGWRDRMRLTRRPPALHAVMWAALGLLGLGVVALVTSWVLLFVR
jgi:hypothetical protein